VHRSPQVMLETFHWYRGEAFDLIVADLLDLPADTGVIVEGFRLLPDLVRPLLAGPAQAVWLVPTPEFRSAAYDSRGSRWAIAGRTSDPDRALRNLLARDAMFTDRLREQTRGLGLPTIEVDPTMSEETLAARVAAALGLTR
jgi:hypothetical protein